MKKSLQRILNIAAAGLIFLASCNKQQAIVTFEGGTAPVLTATAADSISLPLSDTTENAVIFSWTNPNYQFSDGLSSQDVTYYLEFDTVNTFNSSIMYTEGISSSLSQTFTVSGINYIVSNEMQLSTGNPHTLYVRVQAFIEPFTSTSAPVGLLSSTPLSFTVIPYALPPAVTPVDENTAFTSDTLYLTGSAVAAGWMTNAASVAGLGFTRQPNSNTVWTITTQLIGGQQFLVVPVAGNWNYKYGTSDATETGSGGTFQYNGNNNFTGPTASGTYTITFNFQTGNFTITSN